MRYAALLVLALLPLACGDFEPPFDFRSSSGANESVESARVTSPGSAIARVAGVFEAPNSCHSLSGSLEAGNTLKVTVQSSGSNDPECGNEPAFISYTATISGLASGNYGVLVIHAPQGQEPRTVLDSSVFVE
ncbi:MAG: hypothetical protein WEB88_04320 [Gemmatimonadota bacterium]